MAGLRSERLDFEREALNEISNRATEKGYEKEVKKEQRKIVAAQREIAQADIRSWSYNVQQIDPLTGLEINNNKFFIIIGITAYFLFK